jgi:hypothetical protein
MKDTRLVQSALFLVFVAATFVYAVLIEARPESVRGDVVTIANHFGLSDMSGSAALTGQLVSTGEAALQEVGEGTGVIPPKPSTKSDPNAVIDTSDAFIRDVIESTSSGTVTLTGAELYYGSLDVFKTL